MRYRTAVYITRANHWCLEDREQIPIAEDEWRAYVAGDPEFNQVLSTTAVNPETGDGIELSLAGQGYWEWLGYSRRPQLAAMFQYNRGGIIVRVPDAEILSKAEDVAAALRARVLSDELP